MRLPRVLRLSLPSLQLSRFALSVVACGVGLAIGLGLHHQRVKRSRRRWPHGVEVRPSRIRGAGEGLFALRTFEAGEELGEYYGQVLSLWQAMNLQNRDYLMGGFGCAPPSGRGWPRRLLPQSRPRHRRPTAGRLNAHVNAHFTLNAAARYVNDNFDKTKLNSRFEKNKAHGSHSPPWRRCLPSSRPLPMLARPHCESRRAHSLRARKRGVPLSSRRGGYGRARKSMPRTATRTGRRGASIRRRASRCYRRARLRPRTFSVAA